MSSEFQLKSLRQQLGWSAAELARYLGVGTESVRGWEEREQPIDTLAWHSLQRLMNFADLNARKLQSHPLAEARMRDLGIEQGLTDQLLLDKLDV